MHELLAYPFDAEMILKYKKRIKKELLSAAPVFVDKKIAILGGSTTHDIAECLALFLLNHGIRPTFYQSEFGQYWQDAMFGSEAIDNFAPDIIYIHTSNRNISKFPTVKDSASEIEDMISSQYAHYTQMWTALRSKFACTIIQNNFEMPFYRLLGNKDASDVHGRVNYLGRLNSLFYEYASQSDDFYINDINYLSASYGLQKWSDTFFWHMYKYSLSVPAIPYLAHNLASIIKSLYGKNKKALVLDLDNTLWGGVVGDDGVEGIQIGHETSMGQVYSEFQEYIKAHKDIGVLLNVNSKNDIENAQEGLLHPEGTLKPDDFIVIKANWENKDQNILDIAHEIGILPESLVFVDDNPVEREIVKAQVDGVSVPNVGSVESFINIIDQSGFFEVTNFSDDDKSRNEMYVADAKRTMLNKTFENYEEYLVSLQMRAVIRDFEAIYVPRITQLTNKSNQFNLTTKRYSQSEIESVMHSARFIGLYGKLSDKFGDNGLVSVVVSKVQETKLHIDLWLMSCRVLKRGMEDAMMDALVFQAQQRGIKTIVGYYYKTEKNSMVKGFYERFGFDKISESIDGDSVWELPIARYAKLNKVIEVEN